MEVRMSTRFYQIMLLMISVLCAALVTIAGTLTPPPPKKLGVACESIPDVPLRLGEKGIISCTGFTPNGDVKVIFNRPDNTSSEDVGKADTYGNFNGTFTVALDRPTGEWTLYLIDLSSGQTVTIPFTVLPLQKPTPTPTVTTTPRIESALPTPFYNEPFDPQRLRLPLQISAGILSGLLVCFAIYLVRRRSHQEKVDVLLPKCPYCGLVCLDCKLHQEHHPPGVHECPTGHKWT